MQKLHVVDADQLRRYGDLHVAVGAILGALQRYASSATHATASYTRFLAGASRARWRCRTRARSSAPRCCLNERRARNDKGKTAIL